MFVIAQKGDANTINKFKGTMYLNVYIGSKFRSRVATYGSFMRIQTYGIITQIYVSYIL